jgi:hypothetical protein
MENIELNKYFLKNLYVQGTHKDDLIGVTSSRKLRSRRGEKTRIYKLNHEKKERKATGMR